MSKIEQALARAAVEFSATTRRIRDARPSLKVLEAVAAQLVAQGIKADAQLYFAGDPYLFVDAQRHIENVNAVRDAVAAQSLSSFGKNNSRNADDDLYIAWHGSRPLNIHITPVSQAARAA